MLFLLSLYIVSSITITPVFFSIEVNVSSLFNITVDNTNPGQNANITEVDITIPSSFTFVADSNGTDALFESFSNTSNVLSWTNSSGYLINGSKSKSFWFNAIAPAFGNYNITVTSVNATGPFSENISITVEDTTKPLISFKSPTPLDGVTIPQSYIPVNITASDNIAIDKIIIELYNETGNMNISQTSSTSPFFYNFTNLDNGTYRIYATVNDTSGNEDSPSRRTIILGTTPLCIANWTCTAWSECVNNTQTRTCTDENSCGTLTGKPSETQSCTACTPDWNCTEWLPEECPTNETQIRTCTDLNNCGVATGKPSETQSCTYGKNLMWLYITIVIVIILIIAGIVFAIFYFKGKKQPQEVYQQLQSPSKPL